MDTSPSPPSGRFAAYRPAVDRTIFILALLGILVAVHIWVQQQQSFSQGCTGFGEAAAASSGPFDCGTVVNSAAGTFLGVSNTIWGFLYYSFVAALTAVIAFVPVASWVRRLKQGRALAIAFGFGYSMYLTLYQLTQLDALCLLCLGSATIATLLFLVVLYDALKPTSTVSMMTLSTPVREWRVLAPLALVVLLAACTDVAYFNKSDEPSAEAVAAANSDVPMIAPVTLPDGTNCSFDATKRPFANHDAIVNYNDPYAGDFEAPVTVVEFFDPNCPHCKTTYPAIMEAVNNYSDQARFVFKPMALPGWTHSEPQVGAMYEVAKQNKFFPMMEAQFENQQPRTGLSTEQLQAIGRDIDMDVDALTEALANGTYMSTIATQRQTARLVGISGVPAILINGYHVAGNSKSAACLGALIEEVAAQTSAEG